MSISYSLLTEEARRKKQEGRRKNHQDIYLKSMSISYSLLTEEARRKKEKSSRYLSKINEYFLFPLD
ncbi:hypothetical protein [Okeania sp. SIO2B3]|uniref:hypothetical protein n=1 Tax=Okeania sp. SIO2B3 TaxID=2607784 RepID=UPI0013C04A2E|nr:hypothetical protein [Okeania sp. SIO2B3]NET40524.1 hypothetical protein [Okeania sp. SIO2B3]